MAADLRKCYSEDDLPTAPWRFPLSFIPFLVLYVFLSKVRMSLKVTIACNGFCLLRHTKIWLACDIISYNDTMFSLVLACTLLHHELRDYSLGQIAFAVFRALPYTTKVSRQKSFAVFAVFWCSAKLFSMKIFQLLLKSGRL